MPDTPHTPASTSHGKPSYPPHGNPYVSARPGNRADVEQRFGPVAHFGDRAMAFLIDQSLVIGGFFLLLIGGGVASTAPGNPVAVSLSMILIIVGLILIFGVALWNRWFLGGNTGQSLGKRVVGLKLIDTQTGLPIGMGKALLRDLTHVIVNQALGLSFLWMLWDPEQQTVGDKAASSTVIKVAKE
ncbi:MAG: RDD family protein [Actinomycetota bacterium]